MFGSNPDERTSKAGVRARRILPAAFAAALVAIAATVAGSTIWFARYSVPDPKLPAQPEAVAYFLKSYADARAAFRAKAAAWTNACPGAFLAALPVPSRAQEDLTVDALYLPAQSAKRRLLVLSSGVHGVEGFAGSAVQRMFMDDFLSKDLLDSTGVLIVHALNPYGFDHVRRVTEGNVDLNRNCAADARLYATKNAGYRALVDVLEPSSRAATRSAGNLFFHLRLGAHVLRDSLPALRQAVGQGQYEFPDGLLYGGRELEPPIRAVAPVLAAVMADYPLVLNIDLHTGYGERGQLHLFPNPERDPRKRALVESLFAPHKIDWGESGDFYEVTGEFSSFLGTLAPRATYLPMTFEYGTLSSSPPGEMKTLQILRLENQGAHHGYASSADETRIRGAFRELFYPSSPVWRTKVIQDTRTLLRTVLPRFEAMP